ncbi:hypothetical protein SAMN05444166_1319 [Singulisphaera sp. GP187]|uniref:hypothetical protein n=1 Tax=Singulisphaera sp. GP187 TaxID=1882752 RepID=UPI000929CA78|nr:hypothetical protein [Singulisphaera sp. GP187]SIN86173.1 hypothetical protein SAMN05444166_1319 [Singulisphaera sp. GP187]
MKFRLSETGRTTTIAVGLLCLGIAAWLWPIGFGGQMPVGGDVTQFSLGLMAVLRDAIRSARLPVWNDRWGYGFPGLAESQMGVYYPPHWVLYGLFPLEAAYTASLVFHTLFGGLGTYWAARRFGASPVGSAFAGFAWCSSGFFLIHLPHQWGYTVGAWMPWAWGLAWLIVRGQGTWRTPFVLALVLTLQILPGHFQLAFYTEVGVIVLTLAGVSRGPRAWQGPLTVAVALLAVAPLAALQVIPTARLAHLAAAARDFEYLSGFSATPLHLVSFVAPGLFHRSPLWRPLAWDPFHTSPEEYLGYIGLVPLYLALVAILRGFRRDPAARALALLVLVTALLSFGPYVPGFRLLIRVPGFSFFRASARWSLATGLALSLLAGKGFDLWQGWRRTRMTLAGFAGMAVVAPLLVLLVLELALASPTQPAGGSGIAATVSRTLNSFSVARVFAREGGDDPLGRPAATSSSLETMRRLARTPQDDLRIQATLARQNRPWRSASDRTFEKQRFSIYRQELGVSSILVVALLAIAPFAGRTRFFATALVGLTALDLCLAGRHRLTDLGPIRPLVDQSPVLANLATKRPGSRTADTLRNMPMVAGAAPILAYRTLDLPCMAELTGVAVSPLGLPGRDPAIAEALRISGVSTRILDPFETRQWQNSSLSLPGWDVQETVQDATLAGWLYSDAWVAQQGPRATHFSLLRPRHAPAVAWLIPLTTERKAEILKSRTSQTEQVFHTLRDATPLPAERVSPTQVNLTIDVAGPAVVIVSQLADPQWRARWVGPEGERDAPIRPIFTAKDDVGWQVVETPDSGRWTLRMNYEARDVRIGLIVSTIAWAVLFLIYFLTSRIVKRTKGHS